MPQVSCRLGRGVLGAGPLLLVAAVSKRCGWRQRGVGDLELKNWLVNGTSVSLYFPAASDHQSSTNLVVNRQRVSYKGLNPIDAFRERWSYRKVRMDLRVLLWRIRLANISNIVVGV